MNILTITMNPAIDMNTRVPQVVPDEKLRPDPPRYDPGGGGINVARAVGILGGRATAFYPAGGSNGDLLQHLLERESVAQIRLPVDGITRMNVHVTEKNSDQQYRFSLPGPELTEQEWQGCLDRLGALPEPPAWVVASGSLPRGVPDDFYAQLARLFAGRSTRVLVDTRGDMLCAAAAEPVFLLKPNIREFQQLIDKSIRDEEHLATEACRFLEARPIDHMVISLGAGGALWVSRGQRRHVRSPTVPIQSRIGAGDSMMGGLVHGLADGKDMADAVRLGVAAGAAAVMTAGTRLCTREDTYRLYEKIDSM